MDVANVVMETGRRVQGVTGVSRDSVGQIWLYLDTILGELGLNFNWVILIFVYREVLSKIRNKTPRSPYHLCWKTSPQRYHVMRLVKESSWQESDQSDNFDRRSKLLEISSTTYIENKQYTES